MTSSMLSKVDILDLRAWTLIYRQWRRASWLKLLWKTRKFWLQFIKSMETERLKIRQLIWI